MSSNMRQAIRDEVHMVERFTQSYRSQLGELIQRMNSTLDQPATAGIDFRSMRWCMEAVDMVLASQAEFARAIDQLTSVD